MQLLLIFGCPKTTNNFHLNSKCVECTELREKLNDAQQQIQKLTEELTESRKKNQKQLETNCDLLITAREEIQRKDARLKDLQKE